MHKLLEGGTKIVFPAYGIAVASGHKRHLFELNPGTRNHETAEQLLKDGWDRLEHVWKVVWAEKIIGACATRSSAKPWRFRRRGRSVRPSPPRRAIRLALAVW